MPRIHPLIARARREGTPLIDGQTVTFVWEGKTAPFLLGDFNDWQKDHPLVFVSDAPEVWISTLSIPKDAYLEYAYFKNLEDDQRQVDRFNNRKVNNGVGQFNHYFYMPETGPTDLVNERDGIPHGEITRHYVSIDEMAVGKRRTVYLYHPPVREPLPLLIVYDGADYLRRARLPVIVDNLISEGRIRPLAMAFINHGGPARFVEYSCSEATLGLILLKLLPLAQNKLNLIDIGQSPGAFGILGASMGGLMSLFTGLRLPHIFGRVLSQSGSFTTWEYDLVVYDLVRSLNKPAPRVWMDVGRYEWLLETNQRMRALMEEKGLQVTYREYNGGHNYHSWRDDVWRGLECLFGNKAGLD